MLQKTHVANFAGIIDEYVLERIDYRARRLAIYFGLSDEQRDDYAQDMVLEVLTAAKNYDPAQSSRKTFINRVLDMFAKNAIRVELNRRRHQCHIAGFLDEVIDKYSPVVNDPRKGELSDVDKSDMQMDFETILSRMPQHLRDICVLLKEYSVFQVAKKLRKHRSTVYRCIAEIEEYFRRGGYDFSEFRATDSN